MSEAPEGPPRLKPSTVNTEAGDGPPPGVGFVTVTFTLPVVATSLAGITAEIAVALVNVVISGFPLKLMTDFASKFVPFTVSVKAVPPGACIGPRLDIVGTGLLALLMVNICAPDGPGVGAGLITVTIAVPAVAMSEAKMAAVI